MSSAPYNRTHAEAKAISATIKKQLGGAKFVAMTGARSFCFGRDGSLNFQIPRSNGVRAVKITLEADDTYTVTFMNIVKYDVRPVAKVEGVYCDMLQEVFTQHTGLHIRL